MSSYGTLRSIQSIGIVYSVVARGATVLACYATCQGNFSEVVPRVLNVITTSEESQMSYAYNGYMFHYISDEMLIIMCITDDDFERSKAFLFLEQIKNNFVDTYGDNTYKIQPYSLSKSFGDVLARNMEMYSEDRYLDVSTDPSFIRLDNIRVKNLDVSSDNGRNIEPLELLSSDDNLSLRSLPFATAEDSTEIRRPRTSCRDCCRRNYGYIIVMIVLLTILVGIVAAVATLIGVEEAKKI